MCILKLQIQGRFLNINLLTLLFLWIKVDWITNVQLLNKSHVDLISVTIPETYFFFFGYSENFLFLADWGKFQRRKVAAREKADTLGPVAEEKPEIGMSLADWINSNVLGVKLHVRQLRHLTQGTRSPWGKDAKETVDTNRRAVWHCHYQETMEMQIYGEKC
jgi:hypothetical protein